MQAPFSGRALSRQPALTVRLQHGSRWSQTIARSGSLRQHWPCPDACAAGGATAAQSGSVAEPIFGQGMQPADDEGQLGKSIRACPDTASLVQLVQQHSTSFQCRHASMALHKAAKLISKQPMLSADDEACVKQVIELARAKLPECDDKGLANMARSFPKGYSDPAFIQQLLDLASERLQEFEVKPADTLLKALTKLGYEDKVFMQRLLERRDLAASGAMQRADARKLTDSLLACSDADALTQLVQQRFASFNFVHAAVALRMASRLMQVPLTPLGSARVSQLMALAKPHLPQCDSRALATMAQALTKLGYKDSAFMQQLVQLAKGKVSDFDALGAASMLQALADMQGDGEALAQQLQAQKALAVSGEGEAMGSRELMSAIAVCDSLDSLAQLAHRQAGSFKPKHIAAAFSKAAKLPQASAALGDDGQACVRQLVQLAAAHLEGMSGQRLVDVACALARLKHNDPAFVGQLLQRASSKVPHLDADSTASLLWALGRLGAEGGVLETRLLEHVCTQVGKFRPQDTAGSLVAMARLHMHHLAGDGRAVAQLVQHLQDRALSQLPAFSDQDIAGMAWALATLGLYDTNFVQQLLQQAANRHTQLNAAATLDLIWVMAKLRDRVKDSQLVQALVAQARRCESGLTPSQHLQHRLINTAWALAALRCYDQGLMQVLLKGASGWLQTTPPVSSVGNLLRAMAVLGHNDPGFVDAAVSKLLSLDRRQLSRQALCNVLWALSMLQHDAAAVVEPLISAATAVAAAAGDPEAASALGMTEQQLCNVHQYLVAMEGAGHVSAELRASDGYHRLRIACRDAMRLQWAGTSAGIVQQAVLEAVRQLPGCGDAEGQQLTEDGDVEAGITLILPCDTKVSVQVDRVSATLVNAPDVLLGPVEWRRRQLVEGGYKVVAVPQADWQQMEAQARVEYLRQRFEQAGVALP